MAIVGRDLDVSERKTVLQYLSQYTGQSVATANDKLIGVSTLIDMFMVPHPGTIVAGTIAAFGVSASPVCTVKVNRFAGGATSWLFASFVATEFSTSGPMSFSGMLATGHTLLNVQYGDMIQLITSAANTAITRVCVELVVKATQDITAVNNSAS